MYQPIADLKKWDNAAKRYYKEKIEIFIKTVMAVSKKKASHGMFLMMMALWIFLSKWALSNRLMISIF